MENVSLEYIHSSSLIDGGNLRFDVSSLPPPENDELWMEIRDITTATTTVSGGGGSDEDSSPLREIRSSSVPGTEHPQSITPPEYEICNILNSDSIETSELFENYPGSPRNDNEESSWIYPRSQNRRGGVTATTVSVGANGGNGGSGGSVDTRPWKRGSLVMLPSSHYSTLMPYQTPQVQHILKTIFKNVASIKTIVDCTAHIGGDAIHFAKVFSNAHIHAIDIDEEATKCLRKNINYVGDVPGVTTFASRFTIIGDDSTHYIRGPLAIQADFYYFDPPWGGPSYYLEKEVNLNLSGIPIANVINEVFERGLTTKVLLKTPRNFAYSDFKANIRGASKLYAVRKYQQRGTIAYYLIVVTGTSTGTGTGVYSACEKK
jgi:hypothetical protein